MLVKGFAKETKGVVNWSAEKPSIASSISCKIKQNGTGIVFECQIAKELKMQLTRVRIPLMLSNATIKLRDQEVLGNNDGACQKGFHKPARLNSC